MPSAKELAKALAYQGEIRNQPRNRFLGGVADFLAPVSEFADRDKLPESIPLLGGMSFADLSGLKGTESLVRDMSHGKSPVRGATLNTAKVDPRLLDLAAVSGAMIPVGKALGKAALREGARQIETGTGVLGSKVMNPRMNMFAGEGAKTADKQALKVAKDMKAAGVPDEAIHAKTGWFAGMADGKWRFEIDDSAAKGQFTHLSPSLDRLAEKAIIHPSIYKAYPDLSEINQLGLKEARESGSNISYSTNGKPSSKGTIIAEAPDEAGIKSVGLHELQHAIQRREGFARGGTPEEFITSTVNGTTLTPEAQEMFNSALIKNHPKMSAEEIAFRQRDAAQKVYESLAGESEARLTAMRMDMTAPERAASYPPSMFDLYVPVKDQIVRYGDNVGGAMMHRPKPAGLLDYQIEHKPMTIEGGAAPLHDLSKSFGEDVYGKNALQYYGSGDARESGTLRLLQSLRGKPDAQVTIYRGAPSEAGGINAGDWVTLDKRVAQDYVDQALASDGKAGKVFSQKVPASHITSWPDSLMEFGYHPPAKSVPKTQYELAHEVAQRNAALPVEQGGLGLPSGNTAMDRAGAMGFDTDNTFYHGTRADIPAFDMKKVKERFPESFGIHTSNRPSEASIYADDMKNYANEWNPNAKGSIPVENGANVMPLLTRNDNQLKIKTDKPTASMEADLNTWAIKDSLWEKKKIGKPYNSVKIDKIDQDPANSSWDGSNFIAMNPATLRSRFAAFDPFRRHEADILAGVGVGGMLDPQAIAEALRQQDRK